jgi:hypothetical protein
MTAKEGLPSRIGRTMWGAMSEHFMFTGDKPTSEDVLIELICVAKECGAPSDLAPWIETLSERERRALWGIMCMTSPGAVLT